MRKTRIQLTTIEKQEMAGKIKQIKEGKIASNNELLILLKQWNSQNPTRPINLAHLQRIRESVPEISSEVEFWDSVKSKVEGVLRAATCKQFQMAGCKNRFGRDTKVVTAERVPFITEAQLDSLRFDFQKVSYCRIGGDGTYDGSTKVLNHNFRNHFCEKGIVLAPFSSFLNREEQKMLREQIGDSSEWLPSDTEGIWKRIREAVVEPEFKAEVYEILHPAFSDEGKKEDRYDNLRQWFFSLVLRYRLIETLSRRHIEKL